MATMAAKANGLCKHFRFRGIGQDVLNRSFNEQSIKCSTLLTVNTEVTNIWELKLTDAQLVGYFENVVLGKE